MLEQWKPLACRFLLCWGLGLCLVFFVFFFWLKCSHLTQIRSFNGGLTEMWNKMLWALCPWSGEQKTCLVLLTICPGSLLCSEVLGERRGCVLGVWWVLQLSHCVLKGQNLRCTRNWLLLTALLQSAGGAGLCWGAAVGEGGEAGVPRGAAMYEAFVGQTSKGELCSVGCLGGQSQGTEGLGHLPLLNVMGTSVSWKEFKG